MAAEANGGRACAVLIGAIFYCAGGVTLTVMPAYLSGIARLYGASPAQLGTLSAVELGAIALGSIASPFWLGRFGWKSLVRVGTVVSIAGQISSVLVRDFTALLAIRFFTGLLGEGLMYALSFPLLRKARNVERLLGTVFAASIVISIFCLYTGPQLGQLLTTLGTLGLLAASGLVASFFAPDGTDRLDRPLSADAVPSGLWTRLAALALITLATLYAAGGGFWSFAEQLVASNAMLPRDIGLAIAIGTGAGLIGAAAAAAVSGRFGHTWPTVGSILVMSAAVLIVQMSKRLSGAIIGFALFNICLASGTIYITTMIFSADRSGKMAGLVPAFETIGMAIGTLVLGYGIKSFGFGVTSVVVGCFFAVTLLLFLTVNGLTSRGSSAATLL